MGRWTTTRRFLWIGALAWAATACASPPALIVDLKTDVVARYEFAFARVELIDPADQAVLRAIDHPAADRDYVSGVRVAELLDLEPGIYTVRVALLTTDARLVVDRRIRVDLRSSLVVTAVLTRDCRGVSCPAGGDPSLTECVGALCVDPRCSPETPERCASPACQTDEDCAAGAACATPRCEAGTCLYESRDGVCQAGQWCDPTAGCVADDTCSETGGCGEVVQLSGGWEHYCALFADGRIACWGEDGLPTAGPTPTWVEGVGPSRQVACGRSVSCSLGVDGAVDCFGWTAVMGGAGDVTRIDGLGAGVTQLVAGTFTACALLEDGRAMCWGDNDAGELGDGTYEPSPTPRLVWGTDREPLVALAAGLEHVCGIEPAGTVKCWGRDDYGQLGDGSTGGSSPRPVRVAGLRDVVDLALGLSHSCALRSDGQVFCWGYGSSGQLGYGELPTGTVVPIPGEPVSGLDDVVQITAGQNHVCALRAMGDVECWGSGLTSPSAVPAPLEGFDGMASIARSSVSLCGRRVDGTLLCQGWNFEGELGDGTLEPRHSPGPVLAP